VKKGLKYNMIELSKYLKEVRKMKKLGILLTCLALVLSTSTLAMAGQDGKKKDCTRIQDGTLLTSDGAVIVPGYDEWGYNYQAHIFNGYYCDAYHDAEWCWPDRNVRLTMKWNDAWLSNMDCDGDGLLDPHYGFDSYIGSGAWCTNHQSGVYDEDGKECPWIYFTKIVAVPADAYKADGIWYTTDGEEIGPEIWEDFATVQEVYNDPCGGWHGVQYLSPVGPGLGHFK
jgi:hypothetical protein